MPFRVSHDAIGAQAAIHGEVAGELVGGLHAPLEGSIAHHADDRALRQAHAAAALIQDVDEDVVRAAALLGVLELGDGQRPVGLARSNAGRHAAHAQEAQPAVPIHGRRRHGRRRHRRRRGRHRGGGGNGRPGRRLPCGTSAWNRRGGGRGGTGVLVGVGGTGVGVGVIGRRGLVGVGIGVLVGVGRWRGEQPERIEGEGRPRARPGRHAGLHGRGAAPPSGRGWPPGRCPPGLSTEARAA